MTNFTHLSTPTEKGGGEESVLVLKLAMWKAIEGIATARRAMHSSDGQARMILADAELELRAALELSK